MRRKAFTLLETMIALGIVVLALGAGATISRTLLIGGQVSEDTFHANQLADNAVEMVRGTQAYIFNSTRANKTISNYFGLTTRNAYAIIPYRSADNSGENLYPVAWCVDTVFQNSCQNVVTKVGGTRNIGQDFTDGGAETIAVNRATSTGDFRNTVDYLTPSSPPNIAIPSFATCGSCTWDYYSRKISLQELSQNFLGPGSAGSAYQLTVVVTNLRTQLSITRSVLLTDFGITGNTGANYGSVMGNYAPPPPPPTPTPPPPTPTPPPPTPTPTPPPPTPPLPTPTVPMGGGL